MFVTLFAFSKKKNSTVRPDPASGTNFTVDLKEETAVMYPVLIFDPASSGMPVPFDPASFTYAQIIQWSRYYFISDWRWLNGRWEASLTIDALATYRGGIGGLSEYILRSVTAYNGYISDTFYPAHTNYSESVADVNLGLTISPSDAFYMLGVICNNSQMTIGGAITYYVLNRSQLANLKSYLMSEQFLVDNNLNNLQEINKEMVKVIYNPFQYIVSCKYFPLPFPTSAVYTTENIRVGWWDIPVQGGRLQAGGYVATANSNVVPTPAHPQSSRGSYLNHAPYTERYIIHPLLGTVLLDSNKIDAGDSIQATLSCDTITGQAVITIFDNTNNITLYQNIIQLAVDIPLAQINTDVLGVARTAVDSTGSLINNIFSGNIGGAITSGISGIINTLEASIPILQSSGVPGNMAMFNLPIRSINIFRQIVNEDFTHKGRPLCEVRTINTLSGYIMCLDAHAEISCLDEERRMIVDYMNNGFYYE